LDELMSFAFLDTNSRHSRASSLRRFAFQKIFGESLSNAPTRHGIVAEDPLIVRRGKTGANARVQCCVKQKTRSRGRRRMDDLDPFEGEVQAFSGTVRAWSSTAGELITDSGLIIFLDTHNQPAVPPGTRITIATRKYRPCYRVLRVGAV
jgi:hypothetical protein